MKRLTERQSDSEDQRDPVEPGNATGQYRNVPWSTELDRRQQPHDPFAGLATQDVPEPAQSEHRSFGVLRQLGLLVGVAAASVTVGLTFAPHWSGVVPNGTRADASAADVPPVAPTRSFAVLSPVAETPSVVPTVPAAAAQVPSQALSADDIQLSVSRPAPGANAAPTATRTSQSTIQGVTDTEIRFGIAAPFAGPAKEMGRQLKLGIETAFDIANENGGVNGRQLKLITADDGYEPARTLNAVKDLYEKNQVFGFVEMYGSPTALVSIPYALEHHALFFGAFSGAPSLRHDPPDRYVFNFRAGYAEETDAIVRYLVKVRRLRPEEIGVLTQQDAYGEAGMDGVTKAMRALRGGVAGQVFRMTYNRNTVNIDDAIALLRRQKIPIKAIVLVATYRPAAKFIEKTRDLYPDMIYATISGVGSTGLADELNLLGPRFLDHVICTQVVPAVDSYSSVALNYKNALAKYFPGESPDYTSLEAYLTANTLIEGLRRVGPQLDTESLVNTLESMHNYELGLGPTVNFGPSDHQAVHKVWGTQLDQSGHYHLLDLE